MTKLGRGALGNATCKPNIEVPCLPASARKNFKVGLLCSYVPSRDHWGGANFDPRGIIWTNLIEVHKEMLHTKYQSCKPPSFRKEEFYSLQSLFLCSKMWPPGRGQFWPKGHHTGWSKISDTILKLNKFFCTNAIIKCHISWERKIT